MTTELTPIEGAVYVECSQCGNRLLVNPDLWEHLPTLIHRDDGSHLYVNSDYQPAVPE